MIDHRAAAPKAASFSTFGDLLRYLRRHARLTQRDLALAVGYSPEHISRLEHNQRVPDQATLRALFIGALRMEHEEALAARLLELAAQRQTVSAPRHTPATTAMPASSQPMALPVPVTPLVGREAELAQIAQLVHTPACRVLTLVGLGGSGKTRLAIATGHEQAARFRHGAVFVPLAALQSPDLVISAIANALGIQISGQVPPLEQVQRFLRDKQILLIMDNAEHLAAGMDVLSPVLHQAPGVKLLLTSRERLHLQGEWVVEVHGLTVPSTPSIAHSMNYGAVQLFVQCARRVRVDFALDDANALAVVRICQLVGGLPLGVELAVQWLRVLPCAEIADELQRNMDLLVAVGSDMPERHRSFRAVFHYSWDLLEADEQRALRQVSVFRGGFGRDAARVVAGTTLPLLRSLIDKALLVHAAPDRYDLHPLVQQYAHEQLVAANEHEQTYDRYAAWYLALAQEAAPQLQGADQRAWLDRLEAEHDNLRMAMCWLLDSGGTEQMARLSSALMSFWRVRGYYGEGRRWLEALLTQGATLAPAVRATVLSGLGELVWAQGEYAYAQTLLEESLALHKTHNPAQVAAVLHRLGAIAGYQGEYEQAAALYHECLALRRAAGDGLGIAATLNNLAVTVEEQGDEAGAEALFEESLHLFRTYGHGHGAAIALGNLGDLAVRQGNAELAAAWQCESLVLRRELGDQHGLAMCLQNLAEVAALREHYEEAARLWGAAEALRDICGVVVPPSDRARYDEAVAAARRQLGAGAFGAAWQAGRALPSDVALEEAQALGAALAGGTFAAS